MTNYKLTNYEKETIILWNEGEDTITVDTFNQKLINRLRKAAEKNPEQYSVSEPDQYGGVRATFPKKVFSYRFIQPMSEDERERYSEMAKSRMLGKKQGDTDDICK